MDNVVTSINNARMPDRPICLITVAGFEGRVRQSLKALRGWYNKQIDFIFIVDFDNTEPNEPNRSLLIKEAEMASLANEIININDLLLAIPSLGCQGNYVFYFDISGATREQIFKILDALMSINGDFNILYTEAENYYPPESLYRKLSKEPVNSITILDDKIENEDVIYSKHCAIVSPKGFTGTIEHGRMPLLIGFLTFKRSRLKCILDEIEFPIKILIVGMPNRHDLQWRKDLLVKINYDNVAQATEPIVELDTLCPVTTFSKLVEIAFINDRYFKYNIYLAPLGSKMQTIGAFFFWSYFKSTAIVFSKPQKYFPETFSEGARGTFIINKGCILGVTANILKNREKDLKSL